jgi:hypothetical protein
MPVFNMPMPFLMFGAPFNPYTVRIPAFGGFRTVTVNKPAVISYSVPRAPTAQRFVQVEPPRSSRVRYYVYDPFVSFIGQYPVLVESGNRVVYLTPAQAFGHLRDQMIGPGLFYSLPLVQRERIWQFSGRRIPSHQPADPGTPITNKSATIATPFTYTVPADTFTDPDDADATFVWSMARQDGTPIGHALSFNAVTRVLSGTPTGPAETVPLRLTATDAFQRKAHMDFNLTIA